MEYIVFAGAIVLIIVLLMGIEYLNSRKYRKQTLEKLYQSYGTPSARSYKADEMEHIAMYYLRHPEEHQIDGITWNDLDMDSIYRKINVSCSAAGDEYLYYRLRTPVCRQDEMEEAEARIHYFAEHGEQRRDVQSILFRLGRMGKYSIYEYLDGLDTLGERKNIKYLVSDLLLIASLGVMFVSVPIGMTAFLFMLCRNIAGYFKEYKEIEPYITSFRYICRLLEGARQMGRRQIPGISKEQDRLMECYHSMRGFIRNTWLIVFTEKGNGNPLSIFTDYLRMIFYLDLIQFNQALRAVRGHVSEIDEMVTLLGQIETAIVIASYRQSMDNGAWCVPSVQYVREQGAGRRITIEDLYHPLLDRPVKNSISTAKGVLITGSNASGKSTFLRAVAVCAVLAQTIHTCPAKRYEAPFVRVYSSMSLKDDLLGGQSYYMVEIGSIKRILDQVKSAKEENAYVLCFVDEVLRGTNTVERIAASTQIMKMLSADNTLCFAATHDVELTKLLEKEYDNYHFEERIGQDDIFFPYRLMPGPAVTRNAIALLKMLGYDERIVEEAENMAERFLESGSWQTAAGNRDGKA